MPRAEKRGSQEVLLISKDENGISYGTRVEERKRDKSKKAKENKTRPLKDLYRFATGVDTAFVIFGVLSSMVNGAGYPLMSILLGGLANTFIGLEKGINAKLNATTILTDNLSVLITANPTLSTSLNSSGYLDEFQQTIVTYSTAYVFMGIFILIVAYVQTSCWMVSCERQIHKIRIEFFKAILRQEISWFDEHQSGELTTQLSDNLDRIKEGIGDKLGLLVQYSAQFLTGFVIAFVYSWKLTLVLMALTPVMIFAIVVLSKIITRLTKREQAQYGVAGAIAEEVLSCIKTVIAFNGQKQECARYQNALHEAKRTGTLKQLFAGLMMTCFFLNAFSSYALAFWFGGNLIAWNEIDPGTVFVVLMSVMSGTMSLGNISPQLSVLAAAKGAAAAIFDIIDAEPKIDPYSKLGKKLDRPQGLLDFSNVKFAYPTRKDVVVLQDVTFGVEPGQCVAIVGSSGSGKSTLVSLLLRFYDADSGQITIDGENIKRLNLHWLRNLIAVVSQEPVLFDASVEENIRFGRPDLTKQELVEAAKMAYAHDFIVSLPEGYRTRVGERGTQLSGGQKQRIAIARALVRRPKILLLDEATSALDAESERYVQQALDNARKGRTTIIIAHRLSTIRNADKIIAVKDGRIFETGTHGELMDKKGLYFDLVMAQTFQTTEGNKEEDDVFMSDESDTDVGQQAGSPRKLTRQRSSAANRKSTMGYTSGSETEGKEERKTSRMLSKAIESVKDRLEREAKEEQAERSTVSAIIKENKQEWWIILLALLGCTVRGVMFAGFGLLYGQMFSVYSKEGDELIRSASFWAVIIFIISVIIALSALISHFLFGVSSEKLTARLRAKAFTNVLRQDAAYFDNVMHSTGKLCTRLATDAPMIKGAVDGRMGNVLASAMTMTFGVTLGFIYGWQLTLLMLTILPIFGLGTYLNMKIRHGKENRDTVLLADAGQIATEAIENIRTVQSLTREVAVFENFCHCLERPYRRAIKHTQVQSVSYSFSSCIVFFFYAACFWFGGFLVTKGLMQPLDVFKVFFVIMFCGMTIGIATAYFPEMIKARVAAGLIMKMINEIPKIDNYSTAGIKSDYEGSVTFDGVYFSYPTRLNAPVLRGMQLHVPPGKTVALVGSSGCGKSTVVNLLERFYDPIDGRIVIGEHDLRSYNIQFAREQLALVSQEPTLFDCSVSENISYGLIGVTHERIVEAAKLANIHDFVLSQPQGYNTRVGEKGIQLSGGQKQRIAIARALVRNPKILLLDEATSALDTESERVVQDALDKARTGRTCIIIAHRLSTIQNADHIAVLKNGRIIEQGTHAELITKRGSYYELTKRQHL